MRTSEPKESRYRKLVDIARRQHGVVSRADCASIGLDNAAIHRLLAKGLLRKALPRTFVIAGGPSSWMQDLSVALLWAGDGCILSHRTAAALWELDRFTPGAIELSVPRYLRSPAPGINVHICRTLPTTDRRTRQGFPVTTIERTLCDLGSVVAEERVEQALEDALRRGLTSMARLHKKLASFQGKGNRGVGTLRRLLDERADNRALESLLEVRVRKLLRAAPLPEPVPQYEIFEGSSLVARVHFAYPQQKVAVEADGYRYHSSRAAWGRDLSRMNALTRLGWRVIKVTWNDVRDRPESVFHEIAAAVGVHRLL